ncbi:MAG: hypothetical protein NVS1B12_04840 [Acidimicrobiales bacterium]
MDGTVPAGAGVLRLVAVDEGAHAPWAMVGEVITAVFRRAGSGVGGGAGATTLPGPGILFAARYQTSPIGPFTELAVVEPVHRRPGRVGFAVTYSVVDDERACRDGRTKWGFPREVGRLRWDHRDDAIRVTWDDQALQVDVVVGRVAFPLLVPVHLLQHRGTERVVVPVRFRGLARVARITVSAPPDGPMAVLAGARRGLVLGAPRLRIDPAVSPLGWAGLASRLGRAPAPAAPGLGPNA